MIRRGSENVAVFRLRVRLAEIEPPIWLVPTYTEPICKTLT